MSLGIPDQSDITIARDDVMKLLDQGPQAFDAWLATLPQDKTLDVRDCCGCFFHNYFLSQLETFLLTSFDEVRLPINKHSSVKLYFPDNYHLPKWYTQFQLTIMGAAYDEEPYLDYRYRYPSTARKALRDVTGVNYGG